MERIFLLSPADCSGLRASMVLAEKATFPLAVRLRARSGAPLGEVFAFLSGLYFRGKLTYALAFARPPARKSGVLVITQSRGLRPADEPISAERLREFAATDVDLGVDAYRKPLMRDAKRLADGLPDSCEVVLLGSVATVKYTAVLGAALGARLRFPVEFVGRGDMSRGGLLLRCVREGRELEYVPVGNTIHRGARPPRLAPLPRSGVR